jgi:ABC-type Fe3+/spermidine/putrescine transport system ATPase subunit
MIGLRGLEVEAGGFVVGPLDLDVTEGEYGVLLGPSGAGKTLVLEAVAGVRRISAGRVLIDGDDVTARAPESRRVGLVFQDGLLFPHLDVARNVAYGARRHGGSGGRVPGSDATRLAELAEETGITSLLCRRPATLSGGERQRVALARALAARPRVLLLDEPLSAVDVEAREDLQDVLRRVSRAEGLTVLHVTHDRAEAFALADRCALLVGGALRQTGAPRDVLRRPADEAVARFLGARNVLAATRADDDARVAVLSAGVRLCVADPLPSALVTVVVRPEDVRVWRAGEAPPAAAVLPGRVVRLELHGGYVLVSAETPARFEALVPERVAERLGLAIGAPVDVTIEPEAVHVLPRA